MSLKTRKARCQFLVFIVGFLILIHIYSIDTNNYLIMEQDDSRLISMIRRKVLTPPDSRPYDIMFDQDDYSTDDFRTILDALFGNKTNGIFIEAGAYDGETASNTLYLEKYLGWSGLLVEPVPRHVELLLRKHRKSWIAPACLSTQTYPHLASFLIADQISHMDDTPILYEKKTVKCPAVGFVYLSSPVEDIDRSKCKLARNHVNVTCYPLYTLLQATGISRVDLFTLDVEGNEISILKTIPFNKIQIDVLLVEVDKVEKEAKVDLVEFMKSSGYTLKTKLNNGRLDLYKLLPRDRLFVKNNSGYVSL